MSELDSTVGGGIAQTQSEIVDLGEPEEILKILECPVCQEVPLGPPIHTCSTGHPICQQCRPKCHDCPLCRQPFSQTRNFVMESLVLNARHSCPNRPLGCQVVLNGEQMQIHRINCEFGSISCQFGKRDNCGNARIPLSQYLEHLKLIHGIIGRTGPVWTEEYKIRGNLSEPQWVYTYKEILDEGGSGGGDGRSQFFFSRVFTVDSLIHWSIAILGHEEEARKFMAVITVDSIKTNSITTTLEHQPQRPRMEWTIPVHSIKWTNDQIRLNGHCAVCPLNFMMDHFMSIQSTLGPTVTGTGTTSTSEPTISRRFQTTFQVVKI